MSTTRLEVLTGHLQAPIKNRMSRAPITTHVLDTALGKPAAGVPVTLSYCQHADAWTPIGAGITDQDGRCSSLLTSAQLKSGTYRIRFDTSTYFASLSNSEPFYPYAEVAFNLNDTTQHYHIPLLLSPYSYSTYRGS